MTQDNEDLLAGVDLHVWRVPPPPSIDRSALLGRALSPAIAPPKTTPRLRWILVAIVVLNALIATLIVVLVRPASTSTTIALPAGGDTDARVRALLQRLEKEQRELERKLDEIRELHTLVQELQRKLVALENERTAPRDRTPERQMPKLRDPPPLRSKLPAVRSESLPVLESLDRVAISTAIEAIKPQILMCGSRSTVKGMIRSRVRVAPDGSVLSASADSPSDATLGACVADALRSAQFPRTQQGGSFSYPFVF